MSESGASMQSRIKPIEGRMAIRPTLSIASVLVLAAVSLSGCHSKTATPDGLDTKAANPQAAPVPVRVAAVTVRPVQRRVSVVGTLHGFEKIVVTPKIEGRVHATHVDVGDRVAPNAVLLDIDPTDYQLAVEESERALEQELSRLGLTKLPGPDFDIERLPAVQRANLLLENAKRQYDRQEKLVATKAAAIQSFEQAETDLKVADASLRQARFDAQTALATVKHRQSVLSLARQKLSETQVKAPGSIGSPQAGRAYSFVVAKRMASAGEIVRAFPSTPVYELVMDDVLKLHILVPERYMSQVKLGLDAEIHVEAYPTEVFPGKLARINPTVDPQSRSFDVEVHVPNPDHRLKHGGFAKGDVIVGTADNALTIPLEAVTRFAGVSKVFKVRDNTAAEVEVTIGTQGPDWVEALGGLQAGDIVVTSGQSRLANGTRVEVRQSDTKTAGRN